MTSQQMLNLIISRQGRFKWGDIYVPSLLAVTSEAPKCSRISRLNSRKLNRTLHLLSTPERVFTQLALYNPTVVDIHEQKMLFPIASVHPLWGHPLTIGKQLKPLEGTLNVAERIGFKHHSIIVEDSSGKSMRTPYPYVGDLLIYLPNATGELYAVNWTVKASLMDFSERRRNTVKTPAQQRKDREHEHLRQRLEELYYLDAGIRTMKVAPDILDPNLVSNLDLLYGRHELELNIDPAILADFSSEVAEAVDIGNPVAEVAINYGARWGLRDQFLTRIYQDIWTRKLLVDMFKPILIDHPLALQDRDVLDVYGSLFAEEAI